MNECQHKDEDMEVDEKAVSDNINDKTAKKKGGGGRNKPKKKRETQEK